MTKTIFFSSACKSCQRMNQVDVRLLGRQVRCNYCGESFRANGRESFSAAQDDPIHYWINFTENSIAEAKPDVPAPHVHSRPPR